MDGLLIGTLADATGVSVETLRFYERQGLLPEPPRTASGYRQYGNDAVPRVRFIRKAKELGFTLSETRELMELRVAPGTNCEDVEARARAKLESIDGKILELTRMRDGLAGLVRACAANEETGDCPIIEALEGRRTEP